MRKKVLFKVCSYILAAAVFAGGGAWLGSSFAGSANTGVLPESAGGTGATNYSAALALKAPLASPTFTGTPKSVTNSTASDATTQIATNEFAQNAINAKVGLLSNLTTSSTTNIVSAVNTLVPKAAAVSICSSGGTAIYIANENNFAIPAYATFKIHFGYMSLNGTSSTSSVSISTGNFYTPTTNSLTGFTAGFGIVVGGVYVQSKVQIAAKSTIQLGSITGNYQPHTNVVNVPVAMGTASWS